MLIAQNEFYLLQHLWINHLYNHQKMNCNYFENQLIILDFFLPYLHK